MKQQAKQKQTTQQKTRRRTAATNTHERQARMASARILNGEQDVSRLLTSAPAARRVVDPRRNPRANRLPGTTRTVLEEAFAADLGAVRLFYDEDAAALASDAGARAFASGPDIFFASGQYQPHTSEGLRLIAHETAHVLQQTGRVDGSGVMRATARYGSGEVQRDDPVLFSYPFADFAKEYRLFATVEDDSEETKTALEKVLSAAQTALTADGNTLVAQASGEGAAFSAWADEVAMRTKGLDSRERREAARQWWDLPAFARSTLLDLMKFTHNFSAAAVLLKRDSALKTVGSYAPFLTYLQQTFGQDWFIEYFDSIPAIADVFPDKVSITVWDYLVHPTRKPTYVGPFRKLATKYLDDYPKTPASGILKDSERVYGAYLELKGASETVFSLLNEYETQYSLVQPAIRRKLVAQLLISRMEKSKASDSLLERKLAEPIQATAKRALEYWTKAEDLLRQIKGEAQQIVDPKAKEMAEETTSEKRSEKGETTSTPAKPAPLPEVPKEIRSNPLFQAFVTDLDSGLTELLGSGGGTPTLLDAKAYQTALESLQEKLQTHRHALSEHISKIILWETSSDPKKFDEAVWFAVAQIVIDQVMITLNSYDKARESEFEERYGGLPDVRMNHRMAVARTASGVAKLTRNKALQAAADMVMAGTDLGFSYMSFVGDWERENVHPSRMKKDIDPPTQPIGGLGINVTQLVALYVLLRTYAIGEILGGLLETYKDDFSMESYGLTARAQQSARERVPYPVRWVADKAFVVWNEQDADKDGAKNLFDLILHHPRYVELTSKPENLGRKALMPATRSIDPFVWMLPNLETIQEFVYSIPALSDLLKDRIGVNPSQAELLTELNLIAMEAREARARRLARAQKENRKLSEIPLTPIEEELEKIFGGISGQISVEMKHARSIRTEQYIQATIRDRKVIEKVAGDLLDAYAENDDITNYSLPTRAIDLIDQFSRDVMPDTRAHTQAQMTLLMLNLADNMENAFIEDDTILTQLFGSITEDRYDIITGLWGHLNDAIDFAEGKSEVKKADDKPISQKQVQRRLRPYLAEGESVEVLLLFGTSRLKILRDALRVRIIQSQKRGGIIGSMAPHELRRVDGKGSIAVGLEAEPMMYEGISYIVTKIERDFVFHPSYGMKGTGSYVQSILKNPDGSDIPRSKEIILLRYIVNNGEEATITADLEDESRLAELATAAVISDIARGLLATAELIQSAFKLGRDIGSLFVPGGPGFVLAMDVVEFMAQDMPIIREDIINAPMKAVRELEAFISPEMRDKMLEKLWVYLLFEGDLPFAESLMAMSKEKESPASTKRKGKFAKLAAFAKNVGLRLLETFFALRARVRSGMIRASRMVQRHALLRRLVGALPLIIEYGSRISGKDIDSAKEVLGALVEGNAPTKISTALRESLDELFIGLKGMEVPTEILPLDLVVEIIIERFVRSLGPKGKIVQEVMEISGVQSEVAGFVARELRSNGLDPNVLWQETIQVELQQMLNDARDEFLEGVNNFLKSYLGGIFIMPEEGLETIEIVKDSEVPTLEAMPRAGKPRRTKERLDDKREEGAEEDEEYLLSCMGLALFAGDPGEPLPSTVRERYESLFGHDFSHVRMHRGRSAARLTRHYQAEALTSGSHIFLGKESSFQSAHTDRVLRHEMAHVLQQTGPRPVGVKQDSQPKLGERKKGLLVDPRREQAADTMARTVNARGDNPIPVLEELPLGGLMPQISDALQRRVIEYLGSDKIANSFVEQIDSLKAVPSKISVEQRGQFEAVVTAADSIWQDVHRLLKTRPTGGTGKNPKPFDSPSAIDGVKTLFSGSALSLQRNPTIRALAFYSFHEKAGKLRLNYGRYKGNLENYLYAKTGVDIKIDYRTMRGGKPPDVEFVRINYIDLGDVSGHSKMYKNMRKATDSHMKTHMATLGAPFTDIEWGKIRESLRGGIGEREAWDNKEYRLSDGFINEMREYVNATGAGHVDTWANYVKTDDVANPLYGGLRVGTHGQLTGKPTGDKALEPKTGPGSGAMNDVARSGRQSHHIPQFLLVEYFSNQNPKNVSRPLKGRTTFPPGFETSGDDATGFSAAGAPKLNFTQLDPDKSTRGRGLPAVSLAAKTHQKGQLHINAATTWGDFRKPDPDTDIVHSGSQGERINRVFYDLLKKELSGYRKITASTPDATVLERANADVKTNAPKVLKAIKKTYMWMYKGMKQSLERTLTKNVDDEQHYEAISYRSFAMSMPDTTTKDADNNIVLKPAYRPTNVGLSGVVTAVENKNKQIMQHWWTS